MQFLKVRSELILQEIERLTGVSTAPPQDQRHKAIEQLEVRLRDLIHNSLNDGHGPAYWKKAVPEDVRDEVEKRIAMASRKQPKPPPADFGGAREKLDFCTLGDYAKIIHINSNWPLFEPLFRRWQEFERHIEAFSEFRNAVMHNSPLRKSTAGPANWPLFGS